ncbi:MAG TPA: S8 family serine peptidase [Jatrophihabitans sp.]|uniref:S8 family serine peptidase n=1 Tax=Jatrophihabitans sp. TaxID=1932789 RepID=UPI002E08DDF0|nr:S8 family serine peptidase [Jatrophihabitans sp.]
MTTLVLTQGGVSPAGAAPAPSTSGPAKSVIVLLRDQHPNTPATRAHVAQRRADNTSDQNAVLARLDRRSGRAAAKVHHYTAANAVSMTVTPAQAALLSSDPSVAAVIPDTKVAFVPKAAATSTASNGPRAALVTPSPSICPTDPSKPLLEPEALQDTSTASDDPAAKTAQQLTDGSGVKVAYIADAIDPNNPDFIRANGDHVITDYKAFSADGPTPAEGGAEAYGDASSIAAQGLVPHDLSTFVNPAYPLPAGCNIRILGMAPGASIVALKIDFYTTSIVQAIDYAVSTDHVDVINESFGGNPVPDSAARSAISEFDDAAVAAGTTVTVSSGDAGTTSTIGNPSTDPNVISVAATTNSRGYQQTGYAGARAFGNGKWVNDEVSSLSSGGFTQRGGTVDLSAPGESGWAACDARAPECANYRGGGSDFQLFGGTSQSAPLTAGAAALVISAYRSTHGGTSPSPAVVKTLLTSTADDLGLPTFEQGAGRLNARSAVEAALTYPGAKTPAPAGVKSNIAVPTGQLNLSGAPGSSQHTSFTVRNVGTKTLTVASSGRDFAATRVSTVNTALDSTSTQTFPYPTTGAPWVYKKVTFSVPAGTQRYAAQMIWQGARKQVGSSTVTPVVRISVFDPSGAYVANSRPQGGAVSANYANFDVRDPAAGTWTAVLYTPAGAAGYTGNVSLRITDQQSTPVGRIASPVLTLAPGQSRSVKVDFTVPKSGGDTSYAITVASSDGHKTAIPVVVRAVVPIVAGSGAFSGSITGGNARGGSAAETFTYAFKVPAGRRDLSVGVSLASDPKYLLEGVLVDPNDETQAIDSNLYPTGISTTGAQGLTLQMTTAAPKAGLWRVVILVVNPVPGTAFEQQFSGTIGLNTNQVTATGLPNSTKTVLPQGTPTTAQVVVKNTGVAPINVQVDPRTAQPKTLQLTSPFGPQEFKLPAHAAPTFLVPPGTQTLTAAAVSDVPALVELTPSAQGIDVVGDLKSGQSGSTISVATVNDAPSTVSTGIWFTDVNEIGAVGPEGAPTANSSVSLSAVTPDFDPAVTSSTGDFWAVATDPNADLGSPVTIQPGQTATITVTITPSARPGKTVTGQLYVYTPPSFAYPTFNTTGDVIAKIPYSYTVGSAGSGAHTR